MGLSYLLFGQGARGGRSPWDEISAAPGPCVPLKFSGLAGWEVRDEEWVAAGHMPCPCSLFSEGSCLPGTLGRGCMDIRVDIGNAIEGHMH